MHALKSLMQLEGKQLFRVHVSGKVISFIAETSFPPSNDQHFQGFWENCYFRNYEAVFGFTWFEAACYSVGPEVDAISHY